MGGGSQGQYKYYGIKLYRENISSVSTLINIKGLHMYINVRTFCKNIDHCMENTILVVRPDVIMMFVMCLFHQQGALVQATVEWLVANTQVRDD